MNDTNTGNKVKNSHSTALQWQIHSPRLASLTSALLWSKKTVFCPCLWAMAILYSTILTDQQTSCAHFFEALFPIDPFPVYFFGHCVRENPWQDIPRDSFGVLSTYSTKSRNLTRQKNISDQKTKTGYNCDWLATCVRWDWLLSLQG